MVVKHAQSTASKSYFSIGATQKRVSCLLDIFIIFFFLRAPSIGLANQRLAALACIHGERRTRYPIVVSLGGCSDSVPKSLRKPAATKAAPALDSHFVSHFDSSAIASVCAVGDSCAAACFIRGALVTQ